MFEDFGRISFLFNVVQENGCIVWMICVMSLQSPSFAKGDPDSTASTTGTVPVFWWCRFVES